MCLPDRVFPLIVVTSVKRGDVGQVCLSLGRGAVERGVGDGSSANEAQHRVEGSERYYQNFADRPSHKMQST